MNPKLGLEQFGSAHVFCMTKFLAQTMISKVSKPNIQKPIEVALASTTITVYSTCIYCTFELMHMIYNAFIKGDTFIVHPHPR